jgi:hypothetical protein
VKSVLEPPKLPLGARILNGVGRAAAGVGFVAPSLAESRLLRAAEKIAGCRDFGPGTFRDGLGRLLESLETEAGLTSLGRIIARQDVLMSLENRLRLVDWHAKHPDIGDEKIERPIVIVGMARTGTTILHYLLAQDSRFRVPRTWEVDRPCPPPQAETYDSDPRIDQVERNLARSESLIPDFRRMHPMGARLPQECVRITSLEFASMLFQAVYRLPSYARWLLTEADLAPAYRFHRKVLQLLQWRCPGSPWVLKSPGHLWSLDVLLAEYPDACLVVTHRDPLKVLSSITSLSTTLRAMASDRVVPHEIAREWSQWNRRAFDLSVDARQRGLVSSNRVVDVQFREFMADPLATVRKIYDRFDLELPDFVLQRMRAYLQANPDDKHGKHAHTFRDTGLDVEEEREKVRRYVEYFDVAVESEEAVSG